MWEPYAQPGRPPPAARDSATPPVWVVVWVAAACQWLRGYMGGMFYGEPRPAGQGYG